MCFTVSPSFRGSIVFRPQLVLSIRSSLAFELQGYSKKIFNITFQFYLQNVVMNIIWLRAYFYWIYQSLLLSRNLRHWVTINSTSLIHLMKITARNAFLEHLGGWIFSNVPRSHPGAPQRRVQFFADHSKIFNSNLDLYK